MWELLTSNWANVLFLLMVLACPLMHAFGHGRNHRRHRDEPREGK